MTDRNEQRLTEDQLNELVFKDVNDPSAWGEPIVVGPSKGPRPLRNAMRAAKDLTSEQE